MKQKEKTEKERDLLDGEDALSCHCHQLTLQTTQFLHLGNEQWGRVDIFSFSWTRGREGWRCHLVAEVAHLPGVEAAIRGQEEQHHVVCLEALPGEDLGGVAVLQQGGQGEGRAVVVGAQEGREGRGGGRGLPLAAVLGLPALEGGEEGDRGQGGLAQIGCGEGGARMGRRSRGRSGGRIAIVIDLMKTHLGGHHCGGRL